MTIRLKDYGITGPWTRQTCDDCGKDRPCVGGNYSTWDEPEYYYVCVVCLVRQIEKMEKYQFEGYTASQLDNGLRSGGDW